VKIKPLIIGDLVSKLPIIQGGMGIGVSLSNLASAVALEGGIGVISAAQIGFEEDDFGKNPFEANIRALKKHIELARKKAPNGIIGVNIMVAMKNYEAYVMESLKSGIDLIISGAGLPTALPKLAKGFKTKLAPIVSSPKAASVIFKLWDKHYQTSPDLVIVEGPAAGGHLGFTKEALLNEGQVDFEGDFKKIIEITKEYEHKYDKQIPVIAAGGVYTGYDIAKYLNMGAGGVQMATRFVATEECDAHINYKNAYINSKKENIQIVSSPVGMPGRAITNKFIDKVSVEKEKVTKCYSCISHCNPAETPYCITKALINAVKGNVEDSLLFCGENAYRVDKIVTVKELMNELKTELENA
jgi:NAD(P)H-dependent flavin oxidoreductase YrpB (nitropropane dioxygenase family)